MAKKSIFQLFLIGLLIFNIICVYSQDTGTKNKHESLEMNIDSASKLISLEKITGQEALSLNEREERGNRGMIDAFIVSKGIQGIQSMIDNHKKKFTTNYSFAITNESFYDQISTLGPFDPTGMRFKGFKLARVIKNDDGFTVDTAFVLKFSVDTSARRMNEIMNNSIFRLKLDSFMLKKAKVKMSAKEKTLNLDFEITFLSSFISDNGQINSDVVVGKFIYSVRNAPVNQQDPGYVEYYKNLPVKNPDCTGQSFLIPRSAGFYKNKETRVIEKCYGEGIFSIKVTVNETSKNNFIDKIIIYHSEDLLSLGNAALQKKFGASPVTPSKSKAATSTPN